MIKYLTKLTDLDFPVALIKKYPDLRDDETYIYYEGKTLLKHGDLYNTINLRLTSPPETYETFQIPEQLLAYKKSLKGKALIDNSLNIWLPCKKIKVEISTKQLTYQRETYLLIYDIPYFLPKTLDLQTGRHPLIAKVDGLYFHIGWSNKEIKDLSNVI
jgi:hypothetical protein